MSGSNTRRIGGCAAAVLGLLTLSQFAAAPAVAAKSPSFHEATVTMLFEGAGGKTRTLTEDVYVYGCPAPGVEAAERQQHRELSGMRLVKMTCGAPPDRNGLAVILLRFSRGGNILPANVDTDGGTPITTKSCKAVLAKSQSALVARFQGHFPGATFVDASCWAMRNGQGPLAKIN